MELTTSGVTMDTLKPPEPLVLTDGGIADNWRRWVQRWKLYSTASGVGTKDEDVQCAVLLHVIGDEAVEVYNTMTIPEADKNKINPLIAKFQNSERGGIN